MIKGDRSETYCTPEPFERARLAGYKPRETEEALPSTAGGWTHGQDVQVAQDWLVIKMSLTRKQVADLKRWNPKLRPAMRRSYERQNKRIKDAGKHTCVPVCGGSVRRVTGRGDRILKRPVLIKRFYECKLCGREMT